MKSNDNRKNTGKDRSPHRVHGFVPIPFYKRYCGWCGRETQFGHAHNMTVCGVCGH